VDLGVATGVAIIFGIADMNRAAYVRKKPLPPLLKGYNFVMK
jgi:hypothetical protein